MRPEIARQASARERFLREARAAAALEHDHVVTIYSVGEDRGVPFLAMQLLRGMSLEDYLRKKDGTGPGTPLNLERVLRLGREIAGGLQAAHERGLIHRDIKPANLWLDSTGGGRVKILDFGLARAEEETARLTRLGTLVGTPTFMAPEQSHGRRVDGRADLFSLGCVLYRLCTGRLPFQGATPLAVLMAVSQDTPPPIRELSPQTPPRLADLVMRLLAKRPEDRPPSARAVLEELQAVEREHAARAPAPPPASVTRSPAAGARRPPAPGRILARPPVAPRPRRRRLTVLAALAGAAALALVGLFSWRPGPAPQGADRAPEARRPAPVPEKALTNSIGMKLVHIPPGKFLMGTSAAEIERYHTERFPGYVFPGLEMAESPQHEVRITRGFYLGAFEVTQREYQAVTGRNPSANKEGPDHPVECVTWLDADAFCKRLSARPEEKAAGRSYRLPTDAEWEYACRAGTQTAFHQGDALSFRQANIDGNFPFGTAEKRPGLGKTVKVGSYAPNAWGLYDMHGNVWEWCSDGMRAYTAAAVADPRGPEVPGGDRVLRGGGWATGACRSAFRKERDVARYRGPSFGFRVACVYGPPAAVTSAGRSRAAAPGRAGTAGRRQ
jgi:formylglycine-generating enzyme required for sulfatase activity